MRATSSTLAGAVALPLILAGSPATAAPSLNSSDRGISSPGVMAEFQGRTIDLSKGWQGAAICRAVSTRVRCFATREEARDDVAAAARVSVAGMSAAADCGGSGAYLAMFSGTNYTGSELDLYDTSGGWANLSAYGFDNAMQSWANGKTCDALVADGTGGTGSRLTLTAKGKSANAGSWNSRASSANVPF